MQLATKGKKKKKKARCLIPSFILGDIVPLSITVTHYEAAVAKRCLHVKLVRIVNIRTNKCVVSKIYRLPQRNSGLNTCMN